MENLVVVFLTALSMAFAHCIGMCGGIVIAYSSAKISKDMHLFSQGFAHLFYSLGRITGYVVIGIICGFIGYKVSISPIVSAWFLIFLGCFLILFAFFYILFPKIIASFEPSPYKSSIFRKLFAYFMESKTFSSFYFLGVLNGFLPCGMVYYFAGIALASGSILNGMLTMGIFGFATFIPMFILGFIFGISLKVAYRRVFLILGFVGMVILGGMNIYKGVNKLQNPVTQHHHKTKHHCNCEQGHCACKKECDCGNEKQEMSCH